MHKHNDSNTVNVPQERANVSPQAQAIIDKINALTDDELEVLRQALRILARWDREDKS